jgi:hypothetical protein
MRPRFGFVRVRHSIIIIIRSDLLLRRQEEE